MAKRPRRNVALPPVVDLTQCGSFTMQLTDRKGSPVLVVEFDRDSDELPQLKLKQIGEGDIKQMTTIFDIEA